MWMGWCVCARNARLQEFIILIYDVNSVIMLWLWIAHLVASCSLFLCLTIRITDKHIFAHPGCLVLLYLNASQRIDHQFSPSEFLHKNSFRFVNGLIATPHILTLYSHSNGRFCIFVCTTKFGFPSALSIRVYVQCTCDGNGTVGYTCTLVRCKSICTSPLCVGMVSPFVDMVASAHPHNQYTDPQYKHTHTQQQKGLDIAILAVIIIISHFTSLAPENLNCGSPTNLLTSEPNN